jgi:hypothetical protein
VGNADEKTDAEVVPTPPAKAAEAPVEPASPWPHFYPPGCPDKKPVSELRLYRLVTSIPVVASDPLMKSSMEDKAYKKDDPCERASLSCHDSADASLLLKKSYPKKFGTALLVAGDIAAQHGRAMQTTEDPHHWALWLYSSVLGNAAALFQEVQP